MDKKMKTEMKAALRKFGEVKRNRKHGVILYRDEPQRLFDFLQEESNKQYTEFRLVIQEHGAAYIHVLGRDSETLNFNL